VWADTIASIMLLKEIPDDWQTKMRAHASSHSRDVIAAQWERLIASVQC